MAIMAILKRLQPIYHFFIGFTPPRKAPGFAGYVSSEKELFRGIPPAIDDISPMSYPTPVFLSLLRIINMFPCYGLDLIAKVSGQVLKVLHS
jgi:hypothetical protein